MYVLVRGRLAARRPSPLAEISRCSTSSIQRRWLSQKYRDKLQKIAVEKSISVEELVANAKKKSRPAKLPEAETFLKKPQKHDAQPTKETWISTRRDNSPVKPLSDFMNVSKILQDRHTPEQISALWTGYHSGLSNKTGRGFLSAVIPLDKYSVLASKAKTYPNFVLPLRRAVDASKIENANEGDGAFEFYFMQWSFHPSPPLPPSDLFIRPSSPSPQTQQALDVSTVLFTPLQEYKLRQSFATPHLILTHYNDFASSHGVVLMRGEVTSSPQRAGSFLMAQHDAQLLAFGLQRFYLSSGEADASEERAVLLKTFHEHPEEFDWKKLLKHVDPTRG